MKDIKVYDGDLLRSKAQVIGHQVNCLGRMGAGVALAIRNRWPNVYPQYYYFCSGKDPASLLGKALPVKTGDCVIMNLFGQLGVRRGAGEQVTDYTALETAMQWTASWMKQEGLTSIALPYGIGCGLGGGDWDTVLEAIHRVFDNTDIEVELWRL